MQKQKETYVFLYFPKQLKNSPFAIAFILDHLANLGLSYVDKKEIDTSVSQKILKDNLDAQWLLTRLMMPAININNNTAYHEIFDSPITILILESFAKFSDQEIVKISKWLNDNTTDNRIMIVGFAGQRAKKLISSI